MEKTGTKSPLLSHNISPESIESAIQKTSERIQKSTFKFFFSKKIQFKLLNQLSQFDFGRFLLQNQGLNGYWTHYVLTHPWFGRKTGRNNKGEPFSQLENFILDVAMRPTQERFEIFLNENQKQVKENAKLACIPSGMLGELLYLDFKGIKNIELTGIDYDQNTFQDAQKLAEQKGLLPFVKFIQSDAWTMNIQNEYDLISSNGLNIYEPDDKKVTELYRKFYDALKPGGKLVTSFLTFPPFRGGKSEWKVFKLNFKDIILQRILFMDILQSKWQCFCTSEQIKTQLKSVGYVDIKFIYDNAKIFPTVIAYKSKSGPK